METGKKYDGYTYVCWDIDTTGQKLIDEMCHIGAHTSDSSFNQYVMPFRDLDYRSRKRHLLRTVNIGFYRVLRETEGGKILKTKSEISALSDFIIWLEELSNKQGKKCVLMNYETLAPASFILIEALKKYDLLSRFKNCVSGFANCNEFIKSKCESTMQSNTIKTLSKVLLNKDYNKPHDALERARTIYEIVCHLSVGESQDGDEYYVDDLAAGLKNVTYTVQMIESAIADMKLLLERQNSLKPIFGPIIKNYRKRRQAIVLRRYLINADIFYEALKDVWTRKEDLTNYLQTNLEKEVPEDHINELAELISKHFNGSSGNATNSSSNDKTGDDVTKNINIPKPFKTNYRRNQRSSIPNRFTRYQKKKPLNTDTKSRNPENNSNEQLENSELPKKSNSEDVDNRASTNIENKK